MPNPSKPISGDISAQTERHPFYKRPLPMLGLIVSVLIVAVACALLWAGHRYQALIELGKDTGQRYAASETAHPFTAPGPTQAIDPGRWEAMFAVREKVKGKITPGMDRLVKRLSNEQKPSPMAAASDLMSLSGDLQALVDTHLAALQEQSMSASEYAWLLGLAVNGSLAEGDDSPAGQAYRDILATVERLSRANENPRDDIDTAKALQAFRHAYDGRTPDKPWVVEELIANDPTVYVLDLLTLAMSEHAEEKR